MTHVMLLSAAEKGVQDALAKGAEEAVKHLRGTETIMMVKHEIEKEERRERASVCVRALEKQQQESEGEKKRLAPPASCR